MVVPSSKEIQWFHGQRYAHSMNSSVRWRAYAKPGPRFSIAVSFIDLQEDTTQ